MVKIIVLRIRIINLKYTILTAAMKEIN